MKVISRKLVRKTIEMIRKLAETSKEDEEGEEGEDEDDKDDEEKDEEKKDELTEDEKEKAKEKKIKEKEDKYLGFWKEFGKNVKLGIIEDPGNRNRLAKLTRWFSTRNMTELTSFDDYIGRAK